MQKVFLLAQDGGEPIDHRVPGIAHWPWTWVRIAFYVKIIKSVRERVQVMLAGQDDKVIENAMPLRWMFFDEEALQEHFDKIKGVR